MAKKTIKELSEFFVELGAAQVGHTEKSYLAHAIGVYRDLEEWGADEELCKAGMFHSIYGTESFQRFALPLERRGEVQTLIGQRAERLAFVNCFMQRATLDENLTCTKPPYRLRNRVTGKEMLLSQADYDDLMRIHLCDWLEQVPRSKEWDYRRDAFRQMAERLGGVALAAYRRVYADQPEQAAG